MEELQELLEISLPLDIDTKPVHWIVAEIEWRDKVNGILNGE